MTFPRPHELHPGGPDPHEPPPFDTPASSSASNSDPLPRRGLQHGELMPLGFLLLVLLEMVFVVTLLMITKCSRWEAVQTAAAVTLVATICFHFKSAVLTIGRRLLGSAGGSQGGGST